MSDNKFKYDFFISYRHADPDTEIATYLHKLLEQYKIPKEIQKKSGKKKISRVFRDEDELSASSDLSQDIREQLTNSEYLIVVCSPNTRQSRWVEQEIRTFIEVRDDKHILPVLIKGEPEDSFPDILLKTEPMAADFRGLTKKDIRKRCKAELLRLVAPALYCSYDELKQRHKAYQMKRFAISASAAALITLLFFSYSTYQSIQIAKNYREKQMNQARLLADKSVQLLDSGDREAALLVAMEALPENESDESMPLVGDAQLALENALYLYSLPEDNGYYADRILHMQNYGTSIYDLDKEARILATCDKQNIVYFWDLDTKKIITSYNLYNRDLSCKEIYLTADHIGVICTSEIVIGFDYINNTVIWEWKLQKDYPYFSHFALSPDKKTLAIGDTEYIFDAEYNSEYYLLTYYIDLTDGSTIRTGRSVHSSEDSLSISAIFWEPEGNYVFLETYTYEDDEHTVLYRADYSSGSIEYFMSLSHAPDGIITYKFSDPSTLVYVYIDVYPSWEYYYPVLDYHVHSINIDTQETLWAVDGSGISRDRDPQIYFQDIELEDGSTEVLTTVNVYSEIINIFRGEVISENNYSECISTVIPGYPSQIHLSENGVLHKLNIASGITYNPDFGRSQLGVDNILVTAQLSEKELIILKNDSGDIHLYNQDNDSSGILFEDSMSASSNAQYNKQGNYVMDVHFDHNTNMYTINIWESSTGKIYYQNTVSLESSDSLKTWGFVGDDYFYCATSRYIQLYSLTEKQPIAVYDHNQAIGNQDSNYPESINNITVCDSDEFKFIFADQQGNLIQVSQKELTAEVLLSSETIQDLIENVPEYESITISSYNYVFSVSPKGTYIVLYSNLDDNSSAHPLLLWNCTTKTGVQIPDIDLFYKAYDSHINLVFSENETKLLAYDSTQQLHSINLETLTTEESIPLDGDSYHSFQYSSDNRYVFLHSYDHLLKVYDLKNHIYTMITDEIPYDIAKWKFYENDQYLLIETNEFSTYPIQYLLRSTSKGEYEVFSSAGPSADGNLNYYLILDDANYMYQYRRPELNDLLQKAREILGDRELTELEKQKYNIES